MKIDSFDGFIIKDDTDDLTENNLIHLWHSVGWVDGSAQVPGRLLTALKNSNTVFTAWDGEKLIGLCSALDDGLNAWISWMIVDAEYQNSGLGSFLIDKMVNNYSSFRIYVQTYHAARFYQKHGFEEAGTSLKINNLSIKR